MCVSAVCDFVRELVTFSAVLHHVSILHVSAYMCVETSVQFCVGPWSCQIQHLQLTDGSFVAMEEGGGVQWGPVTLQPSKGAVTHCF